MDNSEIFSSLPKEVCDVSHLIGIEPGTSNKKPEETICDWIPKKDQNDDFKYKFYSLYETIEQNKSSSCSKQRGKKCLNSKQRKALFNLNKDKLDFKQFKAINQLWHSYLDSILEDVKTKADELKLARIDLHGAYLLVCSSKNPSVIGVKGYMVQESKNTFRILNNQNRLLEIPKHGTIFAFKHGNRLYKINGYNIMMSSFNRSKAKPKMNFISDL
ncbi:ribonuclease P/MRP subunit POP4 isoform X2 [Dermatophagoides farinae]|uniref:Ribonuclease P protein subunit p29 n=1 Tax=Dermatophagoides farinae TaxID=6954 RepID=A0A9D4P048_DERFA|nr:ribonuclease P protein subunit p29-like isoform X2 [Dermatophagoides farinae]KAH7642360.1 ribonuclease p protein subunit p29-like protein [Dermatophagoides farinae]